MSKKSPQQVKPIVARNLRETVRRNGGRMSQQQAEARTEKALRRGYRREQE